MSSTRSLAIDQSHLDHSVPKISDMITREGRADWRALNRSPFTFHHNLQSHPLFELSRLTRVAERAIEGRRNLFIPENEELNRLPWKERFAEAIRRLEKGSLWLKIIRVYELDPDYGDFLHSILTEIEDLSGEPLRAVWGSLTVIIASPNVVTPYHFDHESNFLFQITGEKDLRVFDTSVVTQEEIERYYAGEALAGKYRDELMNRSVLFHLVPGLAAHHPPLAPHLVNNSNNVSVSVSVAYSDRALYERAKIYQANYCLRCLGFQPDPPGENTFRERLKLAAIGALAKSSPRTFDEMFSGINKVLLPQRCANRLSRWVSRR